MKDKLFWLEHLFWMLGNVYLDILKGKIYSAIESYYFIKIHLSYKGKCIKNSKMSIKNKLIIVLGVIITLLLLYFITWILKKLLILSIQ